MCPDKQLPIGLAKPNGNDDASDDTMCHGYCEGTRAPGRFVSQGRPQCVLLSLLATSRLAGGCVIWAGTMVIGVLRMLIAFPRLPSCYRAADFLAFWILDRPPFCLLGNYCGHSPHAGCPMALAISCGLRLTVHFPI